MDGRSGWGEEEEKNPASDPKGECRQLIFIGMYTKYALSIIVFPTYMRRKGCVVDID